MTRSTDYKIKLQKHTANIKAIPSAFLKKFSLIRSFAFNFCKESFHIVRAYQQYIQIYTVVMLKIHK